MKHFRWKKIYETGFSEIDKQHQNLFEIANTFYNELFSETFSPDNESIFLILGELKAYSEFHCNFETKIFSEEFIEKYFSPNDNLQKKIETLLNDYKENNIIVLYSFAEFLRKWLLKHILMLNDTEFKKIINSETFNISCN